MLTFIWKLWGRAVTGYKKCWVKFYKRTWNPESALCSLSSFLRLSTTINCLLWVSVVRRPSLFGRLSIIINELPTRSLRQKPEISVCIVFSPGLDGLAVLREAENNWPPKCYRRCRFPKPTDSTRRDSLKDFWWDSRCPRRHSVNEPRDDW